MGTRWGQRLMDASSTPVSLSLHLLSSFYPNSPLFVHFNFQEDLLYLATSLKLVFKNNSEKLFLIVYCFRNKIVGFSRPPVKNISLAKIFSFLRVLWIEPINECWETAQSFSGLHFIDSELDSFSPLVHTWIRKESWEKHFLFWMAPQDMPVI